MGIERKLKMKFQTLIIAIFSVLLTGCTASEAVKIPGGESYTVTVLGDVHYDGKQYRITPEKTPALQQKRELNINQWLDKSPQLLTAAAKMSRDGVPISSSWATSSTADAITQSCRAQR